MSHKTPFSKICQWKYDIVQIECKLSKKAFSVQSILVFHWLNLENDEIETCSRFYVMPLTAVSCAYFIEDQCENYIAKLHFAEIPGNLTFND